MKEGGLRRVVIPLSQGYQNTSQGRIPPDYFDRQRLYTTIFNQTRLANGEGDTLGTLIFDIELLKFEFREPQSQSVTLANLDNMLGKHLCEKVNEYRSFIGEETSKLHLILSNPEQSKHLETATMRVHGMLIDFVNLRAETYAKSSRIPTMEFGTSVEDALRQDLTINSLFYNISKRRVGDLTLRGLNDLKAGVIRTPLPSKETFLNDPLRVMRALRFGARFGFELEDEMKEATLFSEVKTTLGNNVSRECIGHEIDLMLRGKKPVTAM